MSIDISAKSAQLLERLANSIYDRDPKSMPENVFCFRTAEIQIVESWLKETLRETDKFAEEN